MVDIFVCVAPPKMQCSVKGVENNNTPNRERSLRCKNKDVYVSMVAKQLQCSLSFIRYLKKN